MEIGLSDDQQLFRETTRQALEKHSPITRVRDLIGDPGGFDREMWRRGAELGWYAMLIPEQYGGGSVSGAGLVDLTIVAEELGRMVHPGPFHAANVVAFALAESGSPAQREEFLPKIAAGELIASWAFAELDKDWSASGVALTAAPSGKGFVLDGVKSFVQDPLSADLFLVTALAPEGLTQFLVPRSSSGVNIEPLEVLDVARRIGNVRFAGVQVEKEALVGELGRASAAIERQLQVALVLQCADSNGATDQGFAMTVQYSKDRVAFGRPIGSYQALKHRMADHRMRLEGSFATTAYAAIAVHGDNHDAAVAAHVAKAHVGKWSSTILHDCIQLHGGIGMTWDYDLHLYFRRAISNEALYGTPNEHYRALVDLAEGDEPK
jgi:alkylation response protein AidB-like acyl-CoA dehydrogenase